MNGPRCWLAPTMSDAEKEEATDALGRRVWDHDEYQKKAEARVAEAMVRAGGRLCTVAHGGARWRALSRLLGCQCRSQPLALLLPVRVRSSRVRLTRATPPPRCAPSGKGKGSLPPKEGRPP